jgi:hypothetical protein
MALPMPMATIKIVSLESAQLMLNLRLMPGNPAGGDRGHTMEDAKYDQGRCFKPWLLQFWNLTKFVPMMLKSIF